MGAVSTDHLFWNLNLQDSNNNGSNGVNSSNVVGDDDVTSNDNDVKNGKKSNHGEAKLQIILVWPDVRLKSSQS